MASVVEYLDNRSIAAGEVPDRVALQAVVAWFHNASSEYWGTMHEDWVLVDSWVPAPGFRHRVYRRFKGMEYLTEEHRGEGEAVTTEHNGRMQVVEWYNGRLPTGEYLKEGEVYNVAATLRWPAKAGNPSGPMYSDNGGLPVNRHPVAYEVEAPPKPAGFGSWS